MIFLFELCFFFLRTGTNFHHVLVCSGGSSVMSRKASRLKLDVPDEGLVFLSMPAEKHGGLASKHGANDDTKNAELDCRVGRPQPPVVPQVVLFH